jgi:hypothetical protein
MYVVVRTWELAGAVSDAIQQRQQEVTEIISGVPGFVAYYATRSGETLTTVTVCEDQSGTQESTRLAGEWVRKNVPGPAIGAPKVAEGETILSF